MPCPFCERSGLENRVFYDTEKWFAFLAAPYHTKGHAILAAKRLDSTCPNEWKTEILDGFDRALAEAATALIEYYSPKDVVFASVRGDISHFHCHLIPLWEDEERHWRKETLYERGHLLEFLGTLENAGDSNAMKEREEKGITSAEQRALIEKELEPFVMGLRGLTSYKGA